jgi:hypothetical protein
MNFIKKHKLAPEQNEDPGQVTPDATTLKQLMNSLKGGEHKDPMDSLQAQIKPGHRVFGHDSSSPASIQTSQSAMDPEMLKHAMKSILRKKGL